MLTEQEWVQKFIDEQLVHVGIDRLLRAYLETLREPLTELIEDVVEEIRNSMRAMSEE